MASRLEDPAALAKQQQLRFEQVYPDRQAEQVERLAHHALRGEVWDKATAYSRQAGLKATARSSPLEAVAHFERALAALGRLPPNRANRELAVDLRIELRPSLFWLGRVESAVDHLNAAASLAAELDDPRRVGRVSAALSGCLWWTGRYDAAVAEGQRARTIAGVRRLRAPDPGQPAPGLRPLGSGRLSSRAGLS